MNILESIRHSLIRLAGKAKYNEVILHQEFIGEIRDITDDTIVTRYEDGNGEIVEQEYNKSGLIGVEKLNVGDRIRAFVFVVSISDEEVRARHEKIAEQKTREPRRIAGADSI